MAASPFYRSLGVTLVWVQLLGPGLVWALEQRGLEVRRTNRAVVSALRGSDLTVTTGETTTAVRFSEPIPFGAPVQTARDSAAEVLINDQAVVTLLSESDVTLEERDGNTIVRLNNGSVLVSAAASALRDGQMVIIETPGADIATRGGRLKATVGAQSQQAEISPPAHEARAYRVATTPLRPGQAPATRLPVRFDIYEGQGQLSAGAAPLVLDAGQAVQVVDGSVSPATGLEQVTPGEGPIVLAATQHAGTPQTGIDLVSQRQMQQVEALQQALFGDPDAQVEGKESERGGIIATLFGTSNPNNPNNPPGGGNLASLFGSGSPYLGALLATINSSGSGNIDDGGDAEDALKAGDIEKVTVKGGPGLLLFTEAKFEILVGFIESDTDGSKTPETMERPARTTINAVSELLRVEGGEPKTAPHGGLPPQKTLIVRGLSAEYPGVESPEKIADNRALPLQYRSASGGFVGPEEKVLKFPPRQGLAEEAKNTVIAMEGLSVPVADPKPRNPNFRDSDEFPVRFFDTSTTEPLGLGRFSSQPDGAIAKDPTNTVGNIESFVDASITARSPLTGDRLVKLSGGVVLDKGSFIDIGVTPATQGAFETFAKKSGFGGGFNGSVLALLADGGNPAFVQIQDRALGVVDGSRIIGSGNVALLSVLDSRLLGPTKTVEGRKGGEIPPLLELSAVDLEGKASGHASAVFIKSAVVVRSSGVSFGALDGALLAASSPILTLAFSQMTTTGHVIDLAGRGPNGNNLLSANLQTTNPAIPRDALVRLDRGSIMTVNNGNLLNLANGASATVNGYLFSLANNSTLTLQNGTLFSLTGNSVFRLNSDAFGVFGEGTLLTLRNSLCAGGECGVLTDHTGAQFQLKNGKPILVSGVGGKNVAVPEGFTPFKFPGGTPPPNQNPLNIGEQAALFHVEPGSELHINNMPVVKK